MFDMDIMLKTCKTISNVVSNGNAVIVLGPTLNRGNYKLGQKLQGFGTIFAVISIKNNTTNTLFYYISNRNITPAEIADLKSIPNLQNVDAEVTLAPQLRSN